MYIMDLNQYAIELVTYLLVLTVYFYELMVCMLLERNAFDSIAFFSQCSECTRSIQSLFSPGSRLQNTNVCTTMGAKQAQHFSDHEKINFQTVDVQGPPTVQTTPIINAVKYQCLYKVDSTQIVFFKVRLYP